MKGGVQWYVEGAGGRAVDDVLTSCDAHGLSLENPASGVATWLNDEPGREGEQVVVPVHELADAVDAKLRAGRECTLQLWFDADNDVVCTVSVADQWGCTLFEFDFDGLTPKEATSVTDRLYAVQREAVATTALWLTDRVGLAVEYGPAHHWTGEHRPAWPAR